MSDRVVHPSKRLKGEITVPGDKSISHRLAMLCGLAKGTSSIKGFLASEDCLNTLGAVEQLGAGVKRDGTTVEITGTGGIFREPAADLDMGNSGTGIRLMAGLLASQPFVSEMTGDDSLRSRPMGRIKNPLELMGADVELLGEGGCAPVRITGKKLNPVRYELPMASAQVKSCVLLGGLFADGRTVVVEPRATRDHTERLMTAMGVGISVDGMEISIEGSGGEPLNLPSGEWTVPGDFSSAAFWLAAGAFVKDAEVVVRGVGLNPRRTAFMDVLKRMGAEISCTADGSADWEEMGDITVKGSSLHGAVVGGDEIPNLIDELPLVAVAGALADGETVIRDAAELRVKESDRISTVVKGLRSFGVEVEEKEDGMIIQGGCHIRGGATLQSHGDHRIAMSMTVLSLLADAPVTIGNIDCIATSYPEFWDHLEELIK